MSDDDPPRADGWEAHRRMQLETALESSALDRIRWLEAAIRFAFRAGALPSHGSVPTDRTVGVDR